MAKIMNRKDAEQHLINKAWKDEIFCKKRLDNPQATIEQELGLEFVDDAEIIIHQETSKSLHLVLPVKPEMLPQESEVEGQTAGSPVLTVCNSSMCCPH